MTLIARRIPHGILTHISDWVAAGHPGLTVTADGSDPINGPGEDVLKGASIALDLQQEATAVSIYARLTIRTYLLYPDGTTVYDDLLTLASDIAERVCLYPAGHTDVVTAEQDSGASILFDGGRPYAYQTLLLTIPTNN